MTGNDTKDESAEEEMLEGVFFVFYFDFCLFTSIFNI
jgi:hypothetical protein